MLNREASTGKNGRPEARLYCFPDGTQLTYRQLTEQFDERERSAIIKRCQRFAKGYSLKQITPVSKSHTSPLPPIL